MRPLLGNSQRRWRWQQAGSRSAKGEWPPPTKTIIENVELEDVGDRGTYAHTNPYEPGEERFAFQGALANHGEGH